MTRRQLPHEEASPPSVDTATEGVYWGAAGPVIEVLLSPREDARPVTPNVARLTRARLDLSLPRTALRRAVVRRVEAGKAILDILVSPNVRSGHTEAPLPARSLRPGDRIEIEVVGWEGGRSLARVVG